jgi:hypothetical protein
MQYMYTHVYSTLAKLVVEEEEKKETQTQNTSSANTQTQKE